MGSDFNSSKPRCGKRPAHSRRRRALLAAAAAALLAVMVYGESWLLATPATACVECAVTASVARALDVDSATP